MADTHWWSIRKTATIILVDYGDTFATLFVTDIRMQKGPPVTIELDLGKNLRTRNTDEYTYIDAMELAEGEITRLEQLSLNDPHVMKGLTRLLRDAEPSVTPWRLAVNLKGRHEFDVHPEIRGREEATDLRLRVVE